MNLTTFTVTPVNGDEPITLDLATIYQQFQQVSDLRKRRGVRYPLALLLTIAVMAKLAGYSQVRAVAEWARLRREELSTLFALPQATMPHPTTWSRVLGHAVLVEALENAVQQLLQPPPVAEVLSEGEVVVNLDGKTLRGTIPAGQTRGVHLLAAYRADCGVRLAQTAVESKTNEIGAAPALLAQLDLHGVVVTGDALHTQRELSTQVVEAGGHYCWGVKENQPTLLDDLVLLFSDIAVPAGCGALPLDFVTASTVEKQHGRLEERVLTASSMLADYQGWPYLAQAFKVERTRIEAGKRTHEVCYGITSLPAGAADAKRLLAIVRAHWGIENSLHYRRDVTLHEDASLVRTGRAPQVLAALNNLVCGLCVRAGITNLAALQRAFARRIDQFLDRR